MEQRSSLQRHVARDETVPGVREPRGLVSALETDWLGVSVFLM